MCVKKPRRETGGAFVIVDKIICSDGIRKD